MLLGLNSCLGESCRTTVSLQRPHAATAELDAVSDTRRVALHRLRSRGRALLPALRANTTDVVSCSETLKPARVQRSATCSVTLR